MRVFHTIVRGLEIPIERLRFDPDPWQFNATCACRRCRRKREREEPPAGPPIVGGFPLLDLAPPPTAPSLPAVPTAARRGAASASAAARADAVSGEVRAGLTPLPAGWPHDCRQRRTALLVRLWRVAAGVLAGTSLRTLLGRLLRLAGPARQED